MYCHSSMYCDCFVWQQTELQFPPLIFQLKGVLDEMKEEKIIKYYFFNKYYSDVRELRFFVRGGSQKKRAKIKNVIGKKFDCMEYRNLNHEFSDFFIDTIDEYLLYDYTYSPLLEYLNAKDAYFVERLMESMSIFAYPYWEKGFEWKAKLMEVLHVALKLGNSIGVSKGTICNALSLLQIDLAPKAVDFNETDFNNIKEVLSRSIEKLVPAIVEHYAPFVKQEFGNGLNLSKDNSSLEVFNIAIDTYEQKITMACQNLTQEQKGNLFKYLFSSFLLQLNMSPGNNVLVVASTKTFIGSEMTIFRNEK